MFHKLRQVQYHINDIWWYSRIRQRLLQIMHQILLFPTVISISDTSTLALDPPDNSHKAPSNN
jgi:hypothetical protein